jgi:hypothetical protein
MWDMTPCLFIMLATFWTSLIAPSSGQSKKINFLKELFELFIQNDAVG